MELKNKFFFVFIIVVYFSVLKAQSLDSLKTQIDTIHTKKVKVVKSDTTKNNSIQKDSLENDSLQIINKMIKEDSLTEIKPIDSLFSSDSLEKTEDTTEKYFKIGTNPKCPSDMVYIEDTIATFKIFGKPIIKKRISFCIDRFEYPNLRGRFPIVNVTIFEAERYCKYRGKRLCKDYEWVSACRNTKENTIYPYGNEYIDYRCNINTRAIAKSGEYKDCHNKFGVFDMIGNVWEWTAGGGVGAYGGSYKNKKAICNTWRAYKLKERREDIGFRCCKDPIF